MSDDGALARDTSPVPSKAPARCQNPMAKLEAVRRQSLERVQAQPAQLPLWDESERGVPNGVLRSALFAAIGRGGRRYLQREAVSSLNGVVVTYTGEMLDQSDLDVWEGVLHLARGETLGHRIEFTEKGFLRLIGRGGRAGRNVGRSDREWLRGVLARLKASAVEIRQGRCGYVGSLIDEYFRDYVSGRYVLILNPRMIAIFGSQGWSKIDWDIRQALRGHPLAQWLHGFYTSHARPHPMRVETLHRLCGSQTGRGARSASALQSAIQGWRDRSLVPALTLVSVETRRHCKAFDWSIKDGRLVEVSRASRYMLPRQGSPGNRRGDRVRVRGDGVRRKGG